RQNQRLVRFQSVMSSHVSPVVTAGFVTFTTKELASQRTHQNESASPRNVCQYSFHTPR
ncbi:hypothetical protein CDAR_370401, partial [Caerostris darwini]